MAGFGVLAFTWSKVAATLSVSLQVPYIASGGFVSGLGLVIVGVRHHEHRGKAPRQLCSYPPIAEAVGNDGVDPGSDRRAFHQP